MRRHLLLACAVVALAATAAVGAAPDFEAARVQPYTPPQPAPALVLPDLQGKTVQLADLRGKVVLVFFWATW